VHVDSIGALRWNGAVIDHATLSKNIGAASLEQPPPFVILDPDPRASCAAVEAARDDMVRSGACSPGRCGEGHGDWNEGAPSRFDTNSAAYRNLEREALRVANSAAVNGSR